MTKAITPNDVSSHKSKIIPSFVIDVVNDLIALNYVNGAATVLQRDIIHHSKERGAVEVFDTNWLNFGEIYRAAGWIVSHDKPAYDESYDASFKFKAK